MLTEEFFRGREMYKWLSPTVAWILLMVEASLMTLSLITIYMAYDLDKNDQLPHGILFKWILKLFWKNKLKSSIAMAVGCPARSRIERAWPEMDTVLEDLP